MPGYSSKYLIVGILLTIMTYDQKYYKITYVRNILEKLAKTLDNENIKAALAIENRKSE